VLRPLDGRARAHVEGANSTCIPDCFPAGTLSPASCCHRFVTGSVYSAGVDAMYSARDNMPRCVHLASCFSAFSNGLRFASELASSYAHIIRGQS
jgi:hypothetical protein